MLFSTHRDTNTDPELQRGAAMVEYALLIVLIALVAIVAIQLVGLEVDSSFSKVADGFKS